MEKTQKQKTARGKDNKAQTRNSEKTEFKYTLRDNGNRTLLWETHKQSGYMRGHETKHQAKKENNF